MVGSNLSRGRGVDQIKFRSTTIEDVKREAGVSTGAIYTYFPNNYLGIEVHTAMGMKLDARQAAKVLATVFADFLPSNEQAIGAMKPVNGKPAPPRSKRPARSRSAQRA